MKYFLIILILLPLSINAQLDSFSRDGRMWYYNGPKNAVSKTFCPLDTNCGKTDTFTVTRFTPDECDYLNCETLYIQNKWVDIKKGSGIRRFNQVGINRCNVYFNGKIYRIIRNGGSYNLTIKNATLGSGTMILNRSQ